MRRRRRKRLVWVPHVHRDGARFHVLWWVGTRTGVVVKCSRPNCVVNRDGFVSAAVCA